MNKKYVILVNDGLIDGGKVFDYKGLEDKFNEWSDGEKLIDDMGDVVSVDDLIELGGFGEKSSIINESMLEMGDDEVEVSVVELDFN